MDRAPSIAFSNGIMYLICMGGIRLSNVLTIATCVNAMIMKETHRKTYHAVGALPFLYFINRTLFRMCPKTAIVIPAAMHCSEYVWYYIDKYDILGE